MNELIINRFRLICFIVFISILGCDSHVVGDGYGTIGPVGPTERRIYGANLAVVDLQTDSLKFITKKIPSMENQDPYWYPDAKHVVFSSPSQNVGVFSLCIDDSAAPSKISSDYLSLTEFSPDGSKILFHTDQHHSYLFNVSDQKLIDLKQWGIYGLARFSPDGSKIIAGDQLIKPTYGKIIIISTDGSDRVEVQTPFNNARNPLITPDGPKIVFDSVTGDSINPYMARSDLYIIDLDGTNLKNLTQHRRDEWVQADQISPDGTTKLCWGSFLDSAGARWSGWFLLGLDGTIITALPYGRPRFSNDGSKVIFSLYAANTSGSQISICDLQGNVIKTIVTTLDHAQLSPDETKIIGVNYWDELVP